MAFFSIATAPALSWGFSRDGKRSRRRAGTVAVDGDVIPANAGISRRQTGAHVDEVPAFAGMTEWTDEN